MRKESSSKPLRARVSLRDEEFLLTPEAAGRLAGVNGLDRMIAGLVPASPPPAEACPHCRWTNEAYMATGYVGCPLCYSALAALRRADHSQGESK
jgi:hypothetical protein